jgi:hypothetical protein
MNKLGKKEKKEPAKLEKIRVVYGIFKLKEILNL